MGTAKNRPYVLIVNYPKRDVSMGMVRQTYITKMPDKAGMFLLASRVISENGGNIVRVNYNKAVDAHTLFIEVQAEECRHERISAMLGELGYLTGDNDEQKIILIVLKLPDRAGAVLPVLEIIGSYNINVSYISSQENGTPYQYFKMGLMVDNADEVKKLLEDISRLCEVKILEYDITEKSLDNTVFYITFANEMREILNLSQEQTNEVIINSNRIMQTLDERDGSPMKTFDYIKQFASFVTEQKGEGFDAEINCKLLPNGVMLYTIQPPCGSNTYIMKSGNELLFVDCGFACYKDEMVNIFEKLFGSLNGYEKSIVLTHADIDHSGLLDIFDRVYLTQSCYDNFMLEREGKHNFREQNVLHSPYCVLSKIISGYVPPRLDRCVILGEKCDDELLSEVGKLSFGGMNFDVMEGIGGHVRGETLLVCEEYRMVFTGDVVVNIKGFTEKQSRFNQLAPYLMTSVNVNSENARRVRELVTEQYRGYTFYPGHGAAMK